MLNGLDHSELLVERYSAGSWRPAAACHQELVHLAESQPELSFLTASLFELLRKKSGQDIGIEYLMEIQDLAAGGTRAGARLLAAFLNVATPGEVLVPRLRQLDSSRRYESGLAALGREAGPLPTDWRRRQQACAAASGQWVGQEAGRNKGGLAGPRMVSPWREMRTAFGTLLTEAAAGRLEPGSPGCLLLVALMRLETDAWQERISRLAGQVDPFRVSTVSRVLPLLNRADAQIRDLRQMIAWVQEGDFETAFVRPQARWRETLDDKDWAHLGRDLQSRSELSSLRRLARGLTEQPLLLTELAGAVECILSVSDYLAAEGVRAEPLDLLSACILAQSHYGNGQVVFTVEKELAEVLGRGLSDGGASDPRLSGVSLVSGLLVLEVDATLPERPDGLPVLRETTAPESAALANWRFGKGLLSRADLEALQAEGLDLTVVTGQAAVDGDLEDEEEDDADLSAAALKHLVLTNIQSVSVLLGFLRNPKVFAIPGLVAEVAVRTRNPQIIATIASDRALHTGFANKGVPIACLRSPVNVSVKILRKFCHVKYVSKVDLKRMAADRTGIRKEIAREIEKYLEALA